MSSTCGKKKSQDGEHSRFVRQWLLNEEKIALTFVKIKLFEYDHDETWNEVLNDLLDWQNLYMYKTDNHDLFI
jgi:hypothetical protein